MNKEKKNSLPLYEVMKKYAKEKIYPFHTPGHKMGLGSRREILEFLTPQGLKMEVSLADEFDDIHYPSSHIKEAQKKFAQLYNAKNTQFFINGTTSAIHAMMMMVLKDGDKVLVPRNAHSSVLGGLLLTGAVPVFLDITYNEELNILNNIAYSEVEKALEKHPDIKGMILISPNYYGIGCDTKKIAHLLHQKNIPLLVDEAHGAHLNFTDLKSFSAIDSGADLVAQSTHKTLGSFTQTSVLHRNSDFVTIEDFLYYSSILQSTSPNYLLLASLDIARFQMECEGKVLWHKAKKEAMYLRERINNLPNISCFGEKILDDNGNFFFDPTKITVNFKNLGIDGKTAYDILKDKFHIKAELYDAYNVLFFITYADSKENIDYIYNSLEKISKMIFTNKELKNPYIRSKIPKCKIPKLYLSPRQMKNKEKKRVMLSESLGKIAAESIAFYPPGIPFLYPGELIDEEILAFILENKNRRFSIRGVSDHSLNTILVVEE